MSTSMPSAPENRRIIPLRPSLVPTPAIGEDDASAAHAPEGPPHPPEDAARHYFKFMLPSIPIATFILTFVLCDVLLGLQSAAIASAAHIVALPEDPSMPLAAALTVSATTGALCVWIYLGYVRLTARDKAPS
jgi:hypothetical protein